MLLTKIKRNVSLEKYITEPNKAEKLNCNEKIETKYAFLLCSVHVIFSQ